MEWQLVLTQPTGTTTYPWSDTMWIYMHNFSSPSSNSIYVGSLFIRMLHFHIFWAVHPPFKSNQTHTSIRQKQKTPKINKKQRRTKTKTISTTSTQKIHSDHTTELETQKTTKTIGFEQDSNLQPCALANLKLWEKQLGAWRSNETKLDCSKAIAFSRSGTQIMELSGERTIHFDPLQKMYTNAFAEAQHVVGSDATEVAGTCSTKLSYQTLTLLSWEKHMQSKIDIYMNRFLRPHFVYGFFFCGGSNTKRKRNSANICDVHVTQWI